MNRLDEMERKGYFTFLQAMFEASDRVVSSFSEEELRQLIQNIGPLVETAKEATHPEVVDLLGRALAALKESKPAETSFFGLLRQMNDPQVRSGMTRMMQVLEAVGK